MWGPYAASYLVGGSPFKWYKSAGQRVLVLGAGASVPLGYPLGSSLLSRIRKNIPGKSGVLYQALRDHDITETRISEFYELLSVANVRSIDNFLDQTVKGDWEFTQIGRLAITNEIYSDEFLSAQLITKANWYHQLRGVIINSFEQNGPTLAIISFNYDRSLTHFFRIHPIPREKLPAGNTTVTDAVPFVHVHGCLGKADSLSGVDDYRPYGAEITPRCLREGAARIQIMHELDRDHGSAMNEAKFLISNADHVVFAGFAYDMWNLERLGLLSGLQEPKWEGGRKYYGLCFKESEESQMRLKAVSAGCLALAPSELDISTFAKNLLSKHLSKSYRIFGRSLSG